MHKQASANYRSGEVQPIQGNSIKLGRAPSCGVSFGDTFPTVSREHAELLKEGNTWVIRHLSSTNPTLLNGKPIGTKAVLNGGDLIRLSTDGPQLVFMAPALAKTTQRAVEPPPTTRNNTVHNSKEPEPVQKSIMREQNVCQFCNEGILPDARVCKHCHKEQLTAGEIASLSTTIGFRFTWIFLFVSIVVGLYFENVIAFFVSMGVGIALMAGYVQYIKNEWQVLDIFNKSKRIKNSRRRFWTVSGTVVGLSILVLLITNPNEADLKAQIKARDNINFVDVTRSESLFLLSIYEVRITDFSGHRKETYIGVLGRFYLVD